jgi:hypothetical protein
MITFTRRDCHSVKWGATLISKSNFLKVRHVSIDDEGTILAQVAVGGTGNRNLILTSIIPAPAPVCIYRNERSNWDRVGFD